MRLVVDTDLWVSYLLKPNSLIAPQLDVLQLEEALLYSRAANQHSRQKMLIDFVQRIVP